MANITCPNLEKYSRKLQMLSKATEGILKYASYDAAGVVRDAVKAATPVGGEDDPTRGSLRESCILVPYQNDMGYVYTYVTFDGYSGDGDHMVPNIIKARVLEHGRSKKDGGITGKHPFIDAAVDSVRTKAEQLIEKNLNEKLEQIMNKE